eukprot:10535144-Alexandrium_andersonii.AAC.1
MEHAAYNSCFHNAVRVGGLRSLEPPCDVGGVCKQWPGSHHITRIMEMLPANMQFEVIGTGSLRPSAWP